MSRAVSATLAALLSLPATAPTATAPTATVPTATAPTATAPTATAPTATVTAAKAAKANPQATIKRLRAQNRQLEKEIAELQSELALADTEIAKLEGSNGPTQGAPQSSGEPSVLGGNAHPTFPAGAPGKLSVVYSAPIVVDSTGFGTTPFVLRNNTSKAVTSIKVTEDVFSGSTLVATGTGEAPMTNPVTIQPGQWALGFVTFTSAPKIPATDTVRFELQPPTVTGAVDLPVLQANVEGKSIAGLVKNTTGKTVGPITVTGYCLDAAGNPQDIALGFAGGTTTAPGASPSYELPTDGSCSSVIVGAVAGSPP